MTVSDIKTGIAERLKENYPEYKVYTENLKQGFNNRCFFIDRITALKAVQMRSEEIERYRYTHSFSITAFSDDKKDSLDEITDCLYHVLSYISVGVDVLKGINMTHAVSDGALIFMVDYATEVKIESEKELEMEVLNVNGGTEQIH